MTPVKLHDKTPDEREQEIINYINGLNSVIIIDPATSSDQVGRPPIPKPQILTPDDQRSFRHAHKQSDPIKVPKHMVAAIKQTKRYKDKHKGSK